MQKKQTDASWKCFVKALENKDPLRLIQSAQEQEQAVLKEFMNNDPSLGKKLDSIERLLIHFKSSMDRSKGRTMYEMGKLEGYVKCLQALHMENSLNELSMKEFEEVKEHLTWNLGCKAKEAICFIYDSNCSIRELENAVKLDEFEFNKLMTVLRVYGILSVISSDERCSLSETGNRIARHLKKQK